MSTSAIPKLIDAMVTKFTTLLPAVIVSDGYTSLNEPGTALYVGVDDPSASSPASAATSNQEWVLLAGRSREEEGEITLAVEALDGDGDAKAARDSVFTVAASIQNHLREYLPGGTITGSPLGVDGVLWVGYTGQTLNQAQAEFGALALLRFTITFKARL